MSAVSVVSPTDDWTHRFAAIWHVDFEFREDANHLPVPVCMFAQEQQTGAKVEMWRDQLLRCRQPPFDVGPNSLMVGYMTAAELSCFLALGWPFPHNVVDLYTETIAAVNGDDSVWLQDERRPGLLEALQLHGLPTRMTKEEKEYWRRAILDNTDYTLEQKKGIQDYNRVDVEETLALIVRMTPAIDLPHALHRGRYMGAVARMELAGLPVDRVRLNRLVDNWDAIKRFYIERDDSLDLWEDLSFREWRLEALILKRGWDWPAHKARITVSVPRPTGGTRGLVNAIPGRFGTAIRICDRAEAVTIPNGRQWMRPRFGVTTKRYSNLNRNGRNGRARFDPSNADSYDFITGRRSGARAAIAIPCAEISRFGPPLIDEDFA
jgi:hypothetical protein